MGVGVKCALYYNTYMKQKYRYLLSITFAVNIILSISIHLCHELPVFEVSIWTRLLVRFLGALSAVGLGLIPYGSLSAFGLCGGLAAISLLLVFFEFYAAHIPMESQQRDDFVADQIEEYVHELEARKSTEKSKEETTEEEGAENYPQKLDRIRMSRRGVVSQARFKPDNHNSLELRQSMRQCMRQSMRSRELDDVYE